MMGRPGDLPLDHVLRPQLPWRPDARVTECGLDADAYPTITRDALIRRAREMGQQRTTVLTCVTCLQTAQNWPTWEQDPVRSLGRETKNHWRSSTGPDPFRDELLAIAALIARHPDEFADLLAGIGSTVRLDDVRRAKRRRG
jgi:hypothetical protein